MKTISEFFKTNYIAIIVAISFGVITFGFRLFLQKPNEAIDSNTKILFQVDSSSFQKEVYSSNRTFLLNLLQEREAYFINTLSSRESVRMESRLFYCAIITGLISLFFIKEHKERMKKYPSYFLLIIIILLYFVDVHQGDLIERNLSDRIITGKAINQLVKPFNNSIYELSYHCVDEEYKKASELPGRWCRKIYSAFFFPDLSQIVYYFVPLIFIFLNSRLVYPKKPRNAKMKYQNQLFSTRINKT